MNKKIRIAITAAFLAVVMLAMTVAVSAVTHRWYREISIAAGTIILTGSLQTNKASDNSEFIQARTTLRMDPSGTGGPAYEEMTLKIMVYGTDLDSGDAVTYYDFSQECVSSNGGYINTPMTNISGRGVDEFNCEYYAAPEESSNFTKFIIINVDLDTESD